MQIIGFLKYFFKYLRLIAIHFPRIAKALNFDLTWSAQLLRQKVTAHVRLLGDIECGRECSSRSKEIGRGERFS